MYEDIKVKPPSTNNSPQQSKIKSALKNTHHLKKTKKNRIETNKQTKISVSMQQLLCVYIPNEGTQSFCQETGAKI